MKKRRITLFLYVLLCFSSLSLCHGQEEPQDPEPYQEHEFPTWAWDIRRWDIIFIGTFPFTMFYSTLIFQMSRYIQSGFEEELVPAPFGGLRSIPLEDKEKRGILISALSMSAVIAFADLIINKIQDSGG